MPKAVLFDLDGTLIDSNAHVIRCFQSAYREVLGEHISPEHITPTFGIPLEQAFLQLNPRYAEALTTAYRRHSDQLGEEDIVVYPDAQFTLSQLKAQGSPLAIVTSKKRDKARHALERFQLAELVDVIIGPEDTPFHKPDPTPVRLALRALQQIPEEALMVGDSPHDILSGRQAGTLTVGVRYSACSISNLEKSAPDYFIDRLLDLIPLTQ